MQFNVQSENRILVITPTANSSGAVVDLLTPLKALQIENEVYIIVFIA